MEKMKRTVTCGELTSENVGQSVVLNGWVHRNRDHGGILFIDLRDRYGITQTVVDENAAFELKEKGSQLKFEYCVAVRGTVRKRPDTMINRERTTGEIEVEIKEIDILSKSKNLPFMVDEATEAREDLRLRYRYLDLRSFAMQRKIALRHAAAFRTREFLNSRGFYEIDTPTFIRSTPEGARDFLVPSRNHPGKFYALPQSPQLFKQILMIAGFDKYFQIARCYRDEDARGDRQPEFHQIDLEMSFVSRDDVLKLTEDLLSYVFHHTMPKELEVPFPVFTYQEAMDTYGSDKPDIRFELPLTDITPIAAESEFKVFKTVAASGGTVKALKVPEGSSFSRKDITNLEGTAKTYGAKGLAWVKIAEGGFEGGIGKFLSPVEDKLKGKLEAKSGDLILMVGDTWQTACLSLGAVRFRLGKDQGLAEKDDLKFAWIVDFPMFERNEEENRWEATHHMFTMPKQEYIENLEENPGEVKGDLYDLVCNGYELASGSIRIHDPELQQRVFELTGFSREEAEKRFGFLLEAFKYGPPPHGGIAPGLDRLVMLMAGEETIREVIPFPKNTVSVSPMDGSPSAVDQKQIEELHLDIQEEE